MEPRQDEPKQEPEPRKEERTGRFRIVRLEENFRSTKASSCERYAGLTLTSTAPMRAVASCSRIHSAQLDDQTPTRSPGRTPRLQRPSARRRDAASSSAHVILRF